MAHLPPKVPNIMHQDSHSHHQQQCQEFMHPHNHNEQSQNPQWVDEFIEFTTAKRGAHRRTVSDSSVAFVEAGPGSDPFISRAMDATEEGKNNNEEEEFDKFDDDQFMSMFSNELGRSSSNPSSTSDHNSTNEDQKRMRVAREKVEEVESLRKFDKNQGQVEGEGEGQGQAQGQGGEEMSHDKGSGNVGASGGDANVGSGDQQGQQPTVDPKRVKRILANRQSAQRSRVRKLQYISELERSVTALQSEVSALSPRVAFLNHQRMILNVDNSTLKAKIAALAQDKIFKDAHQEAMKREIERLRQVYYQQNLNKTSDGIIPPPASSSIPPTSQPPPPPDPTVHENEHLNG